MSYLLLVPQGVITMGKRANSEGSIYRRKSDGKWVASITLDDGKRKVFYGKTQKEVKDKLAKARSEQEQGTLQYCSNKNTSSLE
jgi:hypothetical protein